MVPGTQWAHKDYILGEWMRTLTVNRYCKIWSDFAFLLTHAITFTPICLSSQFEL